MDCGLHSCVLGAGSWGTAFARYLQGLGGRTVLWVRRPELAQALSSTRQNAEYLPGVELPSQIVLTSDLGEAVEDAEVVFFAVPSFAMRDTAQRVARFLRQGVPVVHLAKGLEKGTGQRMSTVLEDTAPGHDVFALSGPSHAEEVARDMPTAVVLGGKASSVAVRLQRYLMSKTLRVYRSADLLGVEYCGVVKNVIAVGTGISDGLGYGDNTRAALITRGLAEMSRFGSAVGACPETFYGLAGLGDMVVTSTSVHSRNRRVGFEVGQGRKLDEVLAGMRMVAEGVFSVSLLRDQASDLKVEMPITEAVHSVLFCGKKAGDQMTELMLRPPKREGD